MKRSAALFLLFLSLSAFPALPADPERIAVAADGASPSAPVSAVAARCPYFLLFDETGTFVEALVNPHKDARGGAGSQAVDLLGGKGVTVVVAGAFGQKMVGAMKARGMRYLDFEGSAADAVKQALAQ